MSSRRREYDSIERALEDLRAGKIILCTDDPDRENEGDMICAAEFATQENINMMASIAKGLRRACPWPCAWMLAVLSPCRVLGLVCPRCRRSPATAA